MDLTRNYCHDNCDGCFFFDELVIDKEKGREPTRNNNIIETGLTSKGNDETTAWIYWYHRLTEVNHINGLLTRDKISSGGEKNVWREYKLGH